MEWGESVPILLMGLVTLLVGVAFRLGRRRGGARWYFDERSPWYIRHYPFALIPGGAFWLVMWVAVVMFDRVPEWMAWAAVTAGFCCALVAFVFMYRPPTFMKPRWLREEERKRAGPVRGPEHRGGLWMVVDRAGFALLVVLAGAGLVVGVVMMVINVGT